MPYVRSSPRILRAWNQKSERLLTGPMGYAPFGPSYPKRDPCPPATSRTATFPAFKSVFPCSTYVAKRSPSGHSTVAGSKSLPPVAACSPWCCNSPCIRAIAAKSSDAICASSAWRSVSFNFSQNRNTCACPCCLRRDSASSYVIFIKPDFLRLLTALVGRAV